MSQLRQLTARILEEGVDGRIDEADLALIKKHLPGGLIDAGDVQVLLELRSAARSVCPAFDEFFFPAFKRAILDDGLLSPVEQFRILRLLAGGGGVDAAEKRFLLDLRRELCEVPPEFEAFCATLGV